MKNKKVRTQYLGYGIDRRIYRIVDAQENFTFGVKRADYKNGVCGDVVNCALSKAVKRSDKNVVAVFTGLTFAYVVFKDDPLTAVRYGVPRSHRDAIDAFDKTGFLAPGDYYFKVPAPSHRLGYKIGQSGTTTRAGIVKNVTTKPSMMRTTPGRRVVGAQKDSK